MIVSCSREIGSWTIRINGHYVCDYWSETKARRVAMRLADTLRRIEAEVSQPNADQ